MDKRQSIIEAARARFRHYGLQKTTMQEIATDADVAVGTLYRYFKDKEELFVACVGEFASHHQGQIDAILATDLPADGKIRRYILDRFKTAREVSTASMHAAELARAVFRLRPERLKEEAAMMEAALGRMLDEGNRAGLWRIDDPKRDARVLMFSIAYFFPNATTNVGAWPSAEDLVMVLDWFVGTWKRTIKRMSS